MSALTMSVCDAVAELACLEAQQLLQVSMESIKAFELKP